MVQNARQIVQTRTDWSTATGIVGERQLLYGRMVSETLESVGCFAVVGLIAWGGYSAYQWYFEVPCAPGTEVRGPHGLPARMYGPKRACDEDTLYPLASEWCAGRYYIEGNMIECEPSRMRDCQPGHEVPGQYDLPARMLSGPQCDEHARTAIANEICTVPVHLWSNMVECEPADNDKVRAYLRTIPSE